MLQQTQVKTVMPYWTRWMRDLPTVQAVARARTERLHKLWEGLGYYTRVRNLQKAARVIVERHKGRFPEAYGEVLALPGVGRYTAGAICSIAFNQPTPILDGNLIRVLTRLYGIAGDPREKRTNTRLWQLAERLVEAAAESRSCGEAGRHAGAPESCSRLNQSLMELGALVCTPREPRCGACPIRKDCVARRRGNTDKLPNVSRRPQATKRRYVAFLVQRGGRYLVRRRPAGVVNAHLWEFPNLEVVGGENEPGQVFRALFGRSAAGFERWCTIKHSITRYRMTLDVFRGPHGTVVKSADACWMSLSAMQQAAFASAHKKVLERLRDV